jgi:carbonic anhydrase
MDPTPAMKELIEGYRAFMAKRWPAEHARYAELAKGQRPKYLVIACSDSRADPAVIFNAGPGQLFIIRNVAAIVPPYETGTGYHGTSAAIAFAVMELKVENVVVLGHAQCGGVSAALAGARAAKVPFLSEWIALLDPAVERCAHTGHDAQTALEHETIKLSLERLMTFPFIAERVEKGALRLHGARFGIADGALEVLDAATGNFAAVPRA